MWLKFLLIWRFFRFWTLVCQNPRPDCFEYTCLQKLNFWDILFVVLKLEGKALWDEYRSITKTFLLACWWRSMELRHLRTWPAAWTIAMIWKDFGRAGILPTIAIWSGESECSKYPYGKKHKPGFAVRRVHASVFKLMWSAKLWKDWIFLRVGVQKWVMVFCATMFKFHATSFVSFDDFTDSLGKETNFLLIFFIWLLGLKVFIYSTGGFKVEAHQCLDHLHICGNLAWSWMVSLWHNSCIFIEHFLFDILSLTSSLWCGDFESLSHLKFLHLYVCVLRCFYVQEASIMGMGHLSTVGSRVGCEIDCKISLGAYLWYSLLHSVEVLMEWPVCWHKFKVLYLGRKLLKRLLPGGELLKLILGLFGVFRWRASEIPHCSGNVVHWQGLSTQLA